MTFPITYTSTFHLYTDDCILYRQIDSSSDANVLQNDLSMLEEWEKEWKMLLNIDKCIVLTVTLKKKLLMTSFLQSPISISQFSKVFRHDN